MEFSSDTFVLDASVFAKWFFVEEMSEKAIPFMEALRNQKIRVVLPEGCLLEFNSICIKKVRRRTLSLDEALQHLDSMLGLPIVWYPDRELLDVSLENSFHFEISAYDALYVSLAEVYVAPLVTADKGLFRACKGRFDFIEYLGDLGEK